MRVMSSSLQDLIVLELDDFVERLHCPACRSTRKKVLASRTAFNLVESFPRGLARLDHEIEKVRRLYGCTECGLRYLSHIPARELLEDLLDNDDLLRRWPQHDRPAFTRARRAIEGIRPQGATILDIGAHTGGFLSTLSSGWRKHALEPLVNSSSKIHDVEVYSGYLEDARLPESAFDCVSAFDIFEHLRDPNLSMARISRALKVGGTVIVETGNAEALGARLLRGGWYYLNYVEHFQAFTERSLRLLFERHGVQVLSCKRVLHDGTPPARVARTALITALYYLLTAGRDPSAWRFLLRRFRPRHTGTPPVTGCLEPDHLFMIGRKQVDVA